MTDDVRDAVRARLAVLDEIDIQYERDRASRAIDALRDALMGVMDHHTPRDPTQIEQVGMAPHDRVKQVCATCEPSAGLIGMREVYPCGTVRAIMARIGVRVDP